MVTASKQNSEKDDKKARTASPNGHTSDENDKDGDSGMRIGKSYQAEIPKIINASDQSPEMCLERALLVWAPNGCIQQREVDEYLWLAKDKYGYNSEQALGMLFWHRHDLQKATRDLANFTPFPDEWTTEDKVLFEQAFQFHGKSFHRIRQMLPDKTIPQLVKYYYLWKKTRQKTSLIDKHARKHAAKLEGLDTVSNSNSKDGGDRSDDENESKDDKKICSNCTIPATILNETAKGQQCTTCFSHWKKMGSLRPTVGPMKRDRQLIKYKKRPPKGMYINHDDLLMMVNPDPGFGMNPTDPQSPGQKVLVHMENEVCALKRQVQANKAQCSLLKSSLTSENINHLRAQVPAQIRLNAKWSNDELLLAVQGVRQFGRNFRAIAEIIGNKSENHVRSFFVTYRKRYNLEAILREWEHEHGASQTANRENEKDVINVNSKIDNGSTGSSTRGAPSKVQ